MPDSLLSNNFIIPWRCAEWDHSKLVLLEPRITCGQVSYIALRNRNNVICHTQSELFTMSVLHLTNSILEPTSGSIRRIVNILACRIPRILKIENEFGVETPFPQPGQDKGRENGRRKINNVVTMI